MKCADGRKDVMKIPLIRKSFSYGGVQNIVEDALLNLIFLEHALELRVKKCYWNVYMFY